MQTFDFKKTQLVPPHCLWVSGLLLISGSRAGAGLPRLHRAWHPAGNRLAMGDRAPGAWGAPGADPAQDLGAGQDVPFLMGDGEVSPTAQTKRGGVSLHSPVFLFWGAVSSRALPEHGGNGAGVALEKARDQQTVPAASGEGVDPEPIRGAGQNEAGKKKVMFIPKPEPWAAAQSGSGRAIRSAKPASFFGKAVTFTPTPHPTF